MIELSLYFIELVLVLLDTILYPDLIRKGLTAGRPDQ